MAGNIGGSRTAPLIWIMGQSAHKPPGAQAAGACQLPATSHAKPGRRFNVPGGDGGIDDSIGVTCGPRAAATAALSRACASAIPALGLMYGSDWMPILIGGLWLADSSRSVSALKTTLPP
jgi:hypothetical protein